MASTRLRKTFHYPSEDDSEPEELDEEHQERLIFELQASDAKKNELYRKLFLIVPLAASLYFLWALFFKTRRPAQALLALLALSSLGCTAYILHFMPIEKPPSRKGKTPMYKLDAAKGPVERYLVTLNAALAGLLLLAAGLTWSRGQYEEAWRQALPMLVFGLIMFARQQLSPLDLEELQRAKYDYKGA